jgi:DnaJ-class molecular chaperone
MDTNSNKYDKYDKDNIEKDKEPMSTHLAFELLDIDQNISYDKLTTEYIKRKYHKMALRFHPDKNGNTRDATNKFQRINEAYSYLSIFVSSFDTTEDKNKDYYTNDNTNDNTNDKMYTTLLSMFLTSMLQMNSKIVSDLLVNIIKDIVINGTKVISLKLIEDLDKDKSIELYNFLFKYKNILHIHSETLDFVSSLIKEKYKNDSVYILNPSIDDILENNIYKLYVDGQLYLVPLWHNELYFEDPSGNDIIVLCNAELPENITIDENNNIYYNLLVQFDKEMIFSELYYLSIQIGKQHIRFPVNKLYIKKEQTYILKGKGISKIIENNVYNVSFKNDIIINITFT